jgi:chromosome segregation protein
MSIATIARRMAGVSSVAFALTLVAVAGVGCSTQDRKSAEQASQDNVALKAQVTDLTLERDNLKKELEAANKSRDQYQEQVTQANKTAGELQSKVEQWRKSNDTAEIGLKSELAKTKSELDAAKKAQEQAEQTAIRLKAAEDAVTAARAKAAEAERAAATASDRVTQLTAEATALRQKLEAVSAELARKPAPAPDLNK